MRPNNFKTQDAAKKRADLLSKDIPYAIYTNGYTYFVYEAGYRTKDGKKLCGVIFRDNYITDL